MATKSNSPETDDHVPHLTPKLADWRLTPPSTLSAIRTVATVAGVRRRLLGSPREGRASGEPYRCAVAPLTSVDGLRRARAVASRLLYS